MSHRSLSFCLLIGLLTTTTAFGQIFLSQESDIVGYNLNGSSANISISDSNEPCGVAAYGGDIYAINSYGTVSEYTDSGTTVNASLIYNYNENPEAIAVTSGGIYLGGAEGGYIQKFPLRGGGYVFNSGGFIGDPNDPISFAITSSNIFVLNAITNGSPGAGGSIAEFNLDGTAASSNPSSQIITGLQSPVGLAVSGSNVFFTEQFVNSVFDFNTTTNTLTTLISDAVTSNANLSDPAQLAVDGSNLYVVNAGNGTVGEFTTSGDVVNASLITGIGGVTGIAIVDAPEPSVWSMVLLLMLGGLMSSRIWTKCIL